MRLQDLLLQLETYPDATPDSAVDMAVAFAKDLGAKLTAIAVQVDIPVSSNPLADRLVNLSGMAKDWEGQSLINSQALLQHFEQTARQAGVYGGAGIEIISLYHIGEAMAQRARTRDLCLVPIANRYDGQGELAKQVIFQSGRPVLAFSADQPRQPGLGRVAIAWDGGRAAARALGDALPILKRAAEVRVVTFLNEKSSAVANIGAEAIRHLSAHGIAALRQEVDVAGESIGAAIDRYLAREPANLLVMGAYGRSRMLEIVLGGATEHVLRGPQVPVLLSH